MQRNTSLEHHRALFRYVEQPESSPQQNISCLRAANYSIEAAHSLPANLIALEKLMGCPLAQPVSERPGSSGPKCAPSIILLVGPDPLTTLSGVAQFQQITPRIAVNRLVSPISRGSNSFRSLACLLHATIDLWSLNPILVVLSDIFVHLGSDHVRDSLSQSRRQARPAIIHRRFKSSESLMYICCVNV